ncbi:MAG TPA: hypothetical protein VGU64_18525 [Terriglobales bacterium]|nr:hypothetical protein [Terriglobales bacterium]
MSPRSVIEYFRTSHKGDVLRAAANTAAFDLRVPEDECVTRFIAALAHARVPTLERFDEIFKQHTAVLPQYFKHIDDLIHNAKKGRTRASYSFLGELILVLEYPEHFDVVYLTESGWDSDIAELVLQATRAARTNGMTSQRSPNT